MGIDCSDFLYRSRVYTLPDRRLRVRDGSLGIALQCESIA